MLLVSLWLMLLSCIFLNDAAPTIAPSVSTEEQDFAEVTLENLYI